MEAKITEIVDKYLGMIPKDVGCSSWSIMRLNMIEEIKDIKPQALTTHEDEPISDFAKQVKEFVVKEWGSHNLDAFVEEFKK